MSFKRDELMYQLEWKARSRALSASARRPGLYTGPSENHERVRKDMFLHETCSEENLLPLVRNEALKVFETAKIEWHDGPDACRPSNFLMDSMVSCVNCLMPFANDGAALATLLRPLVPDATGSLVVEDGRFLSFEWMGLDNPLREPSPKRKRGSHGTSVDAFCVLARGDGRATGVLIEWKYTESYPKEERKYGRHYVSHLEAADGPLDLAACGGAGALFVEPLYQLARTQLLAHVSERGRVFGCDTMIVAVIVPDGNLAYREHVPGAALRALFPRLNVAEVWTRILRRPDRFALVSFDSLLAAFPDQAFPAIAPALAEVRDRYFRGWFREP